MFAEKDAEYLENYLPFLLTTDKKLVICKIISALMPFKTMNTIFLQIYQENFICRMFGDY